MPTFKEFDRTRCLNNIYSLCRQNNVKIGELEAAASLSAGYLSRMIKDEATGKPSIELLLAASSMLNVSVDLLLNVDFNTLTDTETYLLQFTEKLLLESSEKKLFWEFDFNEKFDGVSCDFDGNTTHRLVSACWDGEREMYVLQYNSFFSKEVSIAGTALKTHIQGADVHLVPVCVSAESNETKGYELYIYRRGAMTKLCCTITAPIFAEKLKMLYSEAKATTRLAKIQPDLKSVMDAFINGEAFTEPSSDDEDGDLPF